jgi:AraC-like DNA-binding protein
MADYTGLLGNCLASDVNPSPLVAMPAMRSSDQEFFRYFPVGERDREWGLYVTGVGSSSVPAKYEHYPKSVHPDAYMFSWQAGRVLHEYTVVYIPRGEELFESKTAGARKVGPGMLLLLFPGEWHRYRPDSETGCDEYWISFNGALMDEWVRREFFSPREPVLDVGIDDILLRHYRELIDQARQMPVGFQQSAAAAVHSVLSAGLAATGRAGMTDRSEEIVLQAKAILEQSIEGTLLIPDLARSFHISEDHFRRIFKRRTGIAPYEYYLELKMHRARHLLRTTKSTLKQIARTLGFESEFHFSKAFKRRTGVSPNQWRTAPMEHKQP